MKLEFSIFHLRGGEEFTMRVSWNHLKNEVWIALEIRPRHDVILSCCDMTEVFSICKQGHDFKSRHCDVKLRKFYQRLLDLSRCPIVTSRRDRRWFRKLQSTL